MLYLALLFQRLKLVFLSAIVATTASACATPGFEANVTRFHTFSETADGQTLLIEPLNADNGGPDASGLEFTRYADLIGGRLAAHGYRPASGQAPDVIAKLGYSVTDTGSVDNGSGSRIGIGIGAGGGGSGGRRSSVGIGLGTSINLGGGPKPIFLHRMTLILLVRTNGAHLFEGQVTSRHRSSDLAHVMPMLVDAMFEGFPGQSGETIHVRLDHPE